MRPRLRYAVVLICLPVALASAVAFAGNRNPLCTLMLGPSGLHVSVPGSGPFDGPVGDGGVLARRIARAHPGWSIRRVVREARRRLGEPTAGPFRRVTVCVRQRCVTRSHASFGDLRAWRTAPGYQRLPVRVVLHSRDGRRKVLRARVTMRPHHANGPQCGTDWVAFVAVEGDRLVVRNP